MRIGLAGPCNPQALRSLLTVTDAERAPHSDHGIPLEHLARTLIPRGHHVIIYTLAPDCPHPLTLTGPGLTIHIGAYRPRHRMRDLFARERGQLIDFMRADPPDILNPHWGYEYALAAQAAAVAPVVISQHDWAPAILFWQPTLYRLGRLALYVSALRQKNPLISPSPYIARNLRKWFGQTSTVIPGGLAGTTLAPRPRLYPASPPSLLAVNQGFSRFKNIRMLLRALPVIRTAIPGTRLRLLGHDHGPGQAAERWARSHGLTEGVDFIGQVPAGQVQQELSQAHALVHPSKTEAFGMVLIEAMAQGTPVIANESAEGPCWVLDHGNSGVLCSVHSATALADACVSLLSDPARWEDISRAGWERVQTAYTMPKIAEAYEEVYRTLLDRQNRLP